MENRDDFKYVLQDTGHLFLGKELTYSEMMERDDVPIKFKAIISNYFGKDFDIEGKMIDHILNCDEKSFSYKILLQLKAEIKYFYKEQNKSIFGKEKTKWVHTTIKFQDINKVIDKMENGEFNVEEISISKLALMMISI